MNVESFNVQNSLKKTNLEKIITTAAGNLPGNNKHNT